MLASSGTKIVPPGDEGSRITFSRRKEVGSAAGIQPPEEPTQSRVRVKVNMGRGPKETIAHGVDNDRLYKLGGDDYPAVLEGTALLALAESHGFARVFGGALNMNGGYYLNPLARAEHPYKTSDHGHVPIQNGFSKAYETGVNVGELVRNQPFDRFKFYLSLDLSTPEKEASAQAFMKEVYAAASEQKLSMLTKSEDHNYDSCNIYTWNPAEFTTILETLHDNYPDIWLPVEHPLQGRVGAVNQQHIGLVQEPILGIGKGSHSSRMAQVGRYIDLHNGNLTLTDVWAQACREAGVREDAPWLVDPTLKTAYMAKRAASNFS